MTTTDTDALIERLCDAIEAALPVDSFDVVHTVLPVVAEEVRKAKAEALREAAPLMHDHHDAAWLETQATEYESGDSDEHR